MKPPTILKLLTTIAFLGTSVGLGSHAQAADLPPWLHEPFAYGDTNQIQGLSGGVGFMEGWQHAQRGSSVVRPSASSVGLDYPGLKVSAGSLQVGASDAMQVNTRKLPAAIRASLTNGSTAYLSFLLKPEGKLHQGILNGYFVAGLVGPEGMLVAGKPGGDRMDRYVVEESGGAGQVASAFPPRIGETALLVLKFQFQNGADRVTLFVNPEPGKPEPAEGLVKSDLDLGVPEELFLYSTGAHRIDELRLGPTFLSVTPTK